MDKTLKNLIKTVLFLAVGVVILYIVYLKFNRDFQEDCVVLGTSPEECNFLETIIGYIKSANYFWVFVSLTFYMISNVSRSLRWQMLLQPLSHKPKFLNALSTVMVGYLVNLGIPRSGEFVRAGLLAKYEKMEPEKVMGTIVTSRVIDVLCLLIIIILTLLLSFDNVYNYVDQNSDFSQKFNGILTIPNLIISGLIGIAIVFFIWKFRQKLFASTIGQKIKKIIVGFWEGIVSIKDLQNPSLFIFHTIVIWVCYYLLTYLIFFSFAPVADLTPVAGLVVFVFGTLGIVVPSPGGMGTYQFLISEALMLYGVAFPEAFAFANIMFFSVQILNVFLGVIGFFFLPLYNRDV